MIGALRVDAEGSVTFNLPTGLASRASDFGGWSL